VLDQSMIMAALDDALRGDALQRHFARDPVSWAAQAVFVLRTNVDQVDDRGRVAGLHR
jgi:hypothetical protein